MTQGGTFVKRIWLSKAYCKQTSIHTRTLWHKEVPLPNGSGFQRHTANTHLYIQGHYDTRFLCRTDLAFKGILQNRPTHTRKLWRKEVRLPSDIKNCTEICPGDISFAHEQNVMNMSLAINNNKLYTCTVNYTDIYKRICTHLLPDIKPSIHSSKQTGAHILHNQLTSPILRHICEYPTHLVTKHYRRMASVTMKMCVLTWLLKDYRPWKGNSCWPLHYLPTPTDRWGSPEKDRETEEEWEWPVKTQHISSSEKSQKLKVATSILSNHV